MRVELAGSTKMSKRLPSRADEYWGSRRPWLFWYSHWYWDAIAVALLCVVIPLSTLVCVGFRGFVLGIPAAVVVGIAGGYQIQRKRALGIYERIREASRNQPPECGRVRVGALFGSAVVLLGASAIGSIVAESLRPLGLGLILLGVFVCQACLYYLHRHLTQVRAYSDHR